MCLIPRFVTPVLVHITELIWCKSIGKFHVLEVFKSYKVHTVGMDFI